MPFMNTTQSSLSACSAASQPVLPPSPTSTCQLREQIQQLKAKAFAHHHSTIDDSSDDSFREARMHEQPLYNDTDAPPAQHHLRLKRRLSPSPSSHRRNSIDLCACACASIAVAAVRVRCIRCFETEPPQQHNDEFTGADGGFKLPRLLHPVLTRQHAVANLKHEPLRPLQSQRTTALARPSRVLPCVTARAIALRLVQ